MQQHSHRLLRQHALQQPHVLVGREQPSDHTIQCANQRGHRNQDVTVCPNPRHCHVVTTQPVCCFTFWSLWKSWSVNPDRPR